jgi:hypothetical protein
LRIPKQLEGVTGRVVDAAAPSGVADGAPHPRSPPRPAARWAGLLAVLVVVGWIVARVWEGLFIVWWFNTDEVVFFQEVIRQLRLDPGQTFFDIPGTPFMTLTSAWTALWWAAWKLFGLTSAANASEFAFEHVQGVYVSMRVLTLGLYVVAVVLAYRLFARTTSAVTAALASVLLASLPIHVHYSHFVRTESLGLVLSLLAVGLVALPRADASWRSFLAAGALAGAATGARFHFALVAIPVLLAVFFLDRRRWTDAERGGAGERAVLTAGAVLATLFAAGAAVALLHRGGVVGAGRLTDTMLLTTAAGPEQYAGAKAAVGKLWVLLGGASLALLLLHAWAFTRRWVRPAVNVFTVALALGFAGGFLVAHPSFLWRGELQLRSVQFYGDWTDPNLAALGPLASWWNVTRYYFNQALPEAWVKIAFVLGAILIAWRRNPIHLAFLLGAAACFVSHPVRMKLWPHHIIPWLPFLCFVAAYPVGIAAEWVGRRWRHPAFAAAMAAAVVGAGSWAVSARFGQATQYLDVSRARTTQITEMERWLAEHVPPDAYVATSYYSLGRVGFLRWIEDSGVPVPRRVKGDRDAHIWWLERSALDGRAGYVCVSRADITFFHDDFERKNPGSTYDPFQDSRFQPVASFGGGFYELTVFRFDLRRD